MPKMLKDLQTPEDVVAYVREKDIEQYLTDQNEPQYLFAYYIANYELGVNCNTFTRERCLEIRDTINRIWGNDFHISEGWGGLECAGDDLVCDIIDWNLGEHGNDVVAEYAPVIEIVKSIYPDWNPAQPEE